LEDAEYLFLGAKPGVRKRPFRPWKVKSVLLDTDAFWSKAFEIGIAGSQTSLVTAKQTRALPRLWQPDPMVEKILLRLLIEGYPKEKDAKDMCQVLDLASGAGRDVAFLSEELRAAGLRNYQVVGIDHRYNDKESSIVSDFWERRGVGNHTRSLKIDLSSLEDVEKAVPLSSLWCSVRHVSFLQATCRCILGI
jgi:hypothetical protein